MGYVNRAAKRSGTSSPAVKMMILDQPTLTLHAGDGFLIDPRTPHNALDIGPDTGQMLSTYIVEIGEPLATFVDGWSPPPTRCAASRSTGGYRAVMGSKGSKPRKPEHSQHLPKVGTPAENEHSLHEEREAVLDQMGLRGASLGAKSILTAILVLLVVGALLVFLLLVVFR